MMLRRSDSTFWRCCHKSVNGQRRNINDVCTCISPAAVCTVILVQPLSLRGFHRGFQKGFHFQNESCDCIKYLNLGDAFIYEEARRVLVNELMTEVLEWRPDVVKKMKEIIRRVVTDPERREEIKRVLSGMEHPIPDDEDLLLTIRSITFFPDNHIEAELVDGERISREMRSYSPGRGWGDESGTAP